MVQGGNSTLHHQIWRLKYTELNEIYVMTSLRSFACALIAIFTSIYFFKLGYSLRDIIFYYLVMYAAEAVFEIVSAYGISKLGPKKLIAASLPLLIIHFGLLLTIVNFHWPLWFIGAEGGFLLALFWQPYHFDFSKAKHREKSTKEVSKLYIALAVLGAIAPFVGGVIATNFGISYLFGLVILLLILAMFPLFKTSERFTPKRPLDVKRIKVKAILSDLISYIGSGWDSTVSATFWPIFIYFIVGSYQAVGIVTSIALVITVIVTYLVGKKADGGHRSQYVKYGSIIEGSIYFVQTLAQTATHVVFVNLAHGFSSSIFSSPYTSEYHLHADEYSRQEYIYTMETAIDLGRITLYGILGILTYFFPIKIVLVAALLLGGIGAMMTALMPPAKCDVCNGIQNKSIKLMPRPAKKATA